MAVAAAALLLAACAAPATGPPPSRRAPAGKATSHAPAGAPTRALRPFYRQRLVWHPCGGNFTCTRLTVPVDYRDPRGATMSLAVIRDQLVSHPLGSLIVNPGGPGGSGLQFVREAAGAFSGLLDRFALVSFDPRGVGASRPIRCVSTGFLDRYLNAPPYPTTPRARQASIRLARRFADACWRRNGRYLEDVATIDAARDMDVLRAALGDTRLTYYGASYGTYLGAKYAQLFPHRIRAMILDGAVNPAQSTLAADRAQAVGFQTDLTDFLRYCVSSGNCPLGSSLPAARRGLTRLQRRVTRAPEPALGSRTLGPGNFFNGLASGFYTASDWPALKAALAQAVAGDGAALLRFADALTERNDRTNRYSNLVESNLAINCVDRPSPRRVAAYRRAAAIDSRAAPFFGGPIAWSSLPCAFWHVPPVESAHPVHAPDAAHPILVIGTTHDPATPYAQAVALTRQLGRARLLTLDGDGHTAFLRGDRCIDAAGDAYLIALRLPPPGTTCH